MDRLWLVFLDCEYRGDIYFFFFLIYFIVDSTLPDVGDWTTTLSNIGIPSTSDAYSGKTYGAFVATSSLNPTNWTRSYSKSAYIDPLPPRANLAILPNALVTRLVFSNSSDGSELIATGVEFADARDRTSQRKVVGVNKEVLLAAGSIGSPQILMLSGVGPRDILGAVGVGVNVDLPGVGQHLQDHIVSFSNHSSFFY